MIFVGKDYFMQFNSFILNGSLHEMIERKYGRTVSIEFPTVGANIDRATGFQNEASLSSVHHIYSNIVLKIMSQNYHQR